MNEDSWKQLFPIFLVWVGSLSGSTLLGQVPGPGGPAPRYQQFQEAGSSPSYAPSMQVSPVGTYPTTPVQATYSPVPYIAPAAAPRYSTAQNYTTQNYTTQSIPTYAAPVIPVSHPSVAPPVAANSEAAVPTEAKAVEEEVVSAGDPIEEGDVEYWYEPGYWFPKKIWSGGAEIGLSGTEGNAQSFSMRAGLNAKRETDRWINAIDLIYNRANSSGVATTHNALFTANNDIKIGDSFWTGFINLILEYDEFRAFDLRVAVNGGVGYQFIKTDSASLIGRFGSGGSTEIGAVDEKWVPEAVFGMEYEHQLSKRQKVSLKVDYFPEWTAYENYRMLTDASWEMLLHEESNMSLKVSAIDRYDSTPAGARPNDIDYALLLLWKL